MLRKRSSPRTSSRLLCVVMSVTSSAAKSRPSRCCRASSTARSASRFSAKCAKVSSSTCATTKRNPFSVYGFESAVIASSAVSVSSGLPTLKSSRAYASASTSAAFASSSRILRSVVVVVGEVRFSVSLISPESRTPAIFRGTAMPACAKQSATIVLVLPTGLFQNSTGVALVKPPSRWWSYISRIGTWSAPRTA